MRHTDTITVNSRTRVGSRKNISIQLESLPEYKQLLHQFVANGMLSFGMDEQQSYELAEVACYFFMNLDCGEQACSVQVIISDVICRTEVVFLCSSTNGTCHVTFDTNKPELVKFIKSVDLVSVRNNGDSNMEIKLAKDKHYPSSIDVQQPLTIVPEAKISIKEPYQKDIISLLSAILSLPEEKKTLPPHFLNPQKVADMVDAKLVDAIAAYSGNLACAILFWYKRNGGVAECYGPYCLPDAEKYGVVRMLQDRFIEFAYKAKCGFAYSTNIAPNRAQGFFESLPAQILTAEPQYFREILEDSGTTVYATKSIEPFIRNEASRLFLSRAIVSCPEPGNEIPDKSIWTLTIRKDAGTVSLRPSIYGKDAAEMLKRFCEFIFAMDFKMFALIVDLGTQDGALFAETAVTLGYKPSTLLPMEGIADGLIIPCTSTEL